MPPLTHTDKRQRQAQKKAENRSVTVEVVKIN